MTTTSQPRTFLSLSAMPHEAFLHLANSPLWVESDPATAPMGHWAYRHTGCGEIVHVPSSGGGGSDAMARAVMDVLMTEFLADPEVTDADRWALVHHLSGAMQLRTTRWVTDQALTYIRSLAEAKLDDDRWARLAGDDHDGSLPVFRDRHGKYLS